MSYFHLSVRCSSITVFAFSVFTSSRRLTFYSPFFYTLFCLFLISHLFVTSLLISFILYTPSLSYSLLWHSNVFSVLLVCICNIYLSLSFLLNLIFLALFIIPIHLYNIHVRPPETLSALSSFLALPIISCPASCPASCPCHLLYFTSSVFILSVRVSFTLL